LQVTLAIFMSYVSFLSDYFFILTGCIRIIPLALLGNTAVSLRRCGFEQTPGFINNTRDKLVHARLMLMPLCNIPGAQNAA